MMQIIDGVLIVNLNVVKLVLQSNAHLFGTVALLLIFYFLLRGK